MMNSECVSIPADGTFLEPVSHACLIITTSKSLAPKCPHHHCPPVEEGGREELVGPGRYGKEIS